MLAVVMLLSLLLAAVVVVVVVVAVRGGAGSVDCFAVMSTDGLATAAIAGWLIWSTTTLVVSAWIKLAA